MSTQTTKPLRPGTINRQDLGASIERLLDSLYPDLPPHQGVPGKKGVSSPSLRLEGSTVSVAVSTPIKTVALDQVLASQTQLKTTAWSDARIRQIPDADYAALAFRVNAKLQAEFSNEACFVTYWLTQRKRHGMRAESGKETMSVHNTGTQEKQLRDEWNRSPQLRAEFMDDWPAYAAFKRAQERGGVRVCNSPVVQAGKS